ncbi:hypothetical protein [Microbacterium sp. NC79]|uniref:hypothetical protein n=1 Tax=Microbacterium sp. NC79 TaxID=2851009 RepID=UPI001C2C76C1|nr:hypothetical protein [Microbacterium sp. NC79]MBV0895390.1 hypothetical protein [Microbacterium sp. NC79]
MAKPETPRQSREQLAVGGDGLTIVAFLLSFGLFIGGIFLLGRSFSVTGAEFAVFAGGLLMCTLGCMVPMHFMRLFDGA